MHDKQPQVTSVDAQNRVIFLLRMDPVRSPKSADVSIFALGKKTDEQKKQFNSNYPLGFTFYTAQFIALPSFTGL